MTLVVEVQQVSDAQAIPRAAQFEAWARSAWRGTSDSDAGVVLRITDEAESRQLNREYRGKDTSTNVLSFPFDPVPELDLHHVGDLVICAPVVVREAAEQHKPVEAHWAHMVVHGMLHLQGYDHETDSQADEMETLETEILTGLGYPAPYATDEET